MQKRKVDSMVDVVNKRWSPGRYWWV